MSKKILIGLALIIILAIGVALLPSRTIEIKVEHSIQEKTKSIEEIRIEKIKEYLEKKESPLADHAEKIASQKHWRLLIAISHIESQFCKRKIAYNCWGLGGDSNYQKYTGYSEAIEAANKLIEKFQQRGKWMTVESMMGSYVVPGSPNWRNTVNGTLEELKNIE